MSDQYFTVNIRAYLDKDKPTYIGKDGLYELLSDFSCPNNPDVEYFYYITQSNLPKKINRLHIWYLMHRMQLS